MRSLDAIVADINTGTEALVALKARVAAAQAGIAAAQEELDAASTAFNEKYSELAELRGELDAAVVEGING